MSVSLVCSFSIKSCLHLKKKYQTNLKECTSQPFILINVYLGADNSKEVLVVIIVEINYLKIIVIVLLFVIVYNYFILCFNQNYF